MTFKEVLDQSGKSRYQVSKETGIFQTTLYRLYSGKSRIESAPLTTCIKLARALGFRTAEELFAACMDEEWNRLITADGWAEINDQLAVLVEDGRVIKGLQREDGVRPEEVYPYKTLEDDHRWTECSGIPAVDFVSLASKGQARFFKA